MSAFFPRSNESVLEFRTLSLTSPSPDASHIPHFASFSRNSDHGYFCRAALKHYSAHERPVWIVSDCRRATDIAFFEAEFPGKCLRVRVKASDGVRAKRGFVFQPGVDDAESECGLDKLEPLDFVIENEGDKPASEIMAGLAEALKAKGFEPKWKS